MKTFRRAFGLAAVQATILLSFAAAAQAADADPLPAWNDTSLKQRIVQFVDDVTNPDSPAFVPEAERVATFDNDGTLWCEKPVYIQLAFVLASLKRRGAEDPTLRGREPYRAAYDGDLAYFQKFTTRQFVDIVLETHADISQDKFTRDAAAFLRTALHPRFDVPYQDLAYAPMVELMDLLRERRFKVFIVSGGGAPFIRAVSTEIYGVPPENVVGSAVMLRFEDHPAGAVLLRERKLVEPIDDGPGKPVNIGLHIGLRPILAAGNADGDIEMLEYVRDGDRPRLQLLVRHDDAEREYAYDSGAERAQRLAGERNWGLISMKNDFRRVFAFQERDEEQPEEEEDAAATAR